jgi:hypothetical protein
VVGAFLYRGATWARWTAIMLAGISMFANFMWLSSSTHNTTAASGGFR